MSRALRSVTTALALLLVLSLAGCGGEDQVSGASSTESSRDSVTIDISVRDGEVQPSGSKVEVKAGQPVHLRIESDAADELHIHSTPEQEVAFEKGTTDKTLTFDQPGVVDVEIHDLDKLVVQLEVR